MPWTIAAIPNKVQKGLDGLNDSEGRKYAEWANRITGQNEAPNTAAQSLGYETKKLKGADNQWELVVGSRARVSYTYNSTQQVVTLLGAGHT